MVFVLTASTIAAAAQPPTTAPSPSAARPSVRVGDTPLPEAAKQTMEEKLGNVVEHASLDNVPAKQAFAWWAKNSGVPLMINWEKMAGDGVDPEQRISLDLRNVPAGKLLSLMMKQISATAEGDKVLLFNLTPWYIQIMTKAEANRHPVIRIYDVRDLMHEAPRYDDQPDFDLNTALGGNISRGGGSARGIASQGGTATVTQEPMLSNQQKGYQLAEHIRQTIEPAIWTNPEFASIRYFNGRLIVKAPVYVHAQIGIPEVVAPSQPGATGVGGSITGAGARPTTTPAVK